MLSETNKLLCTNCKHSFVPFNERLLALLSFSFKPSRYAYKCKKAYNPDDEEFHVVDGPPKVKRQDEN